VARPAVFSLEVAEMAGRICGICATDSTMKRAAELIAEVLPDQKIADFLGYPGNAGRMLVSRHRRFHVEAPVKAIAEAAGKGRANVEQRDQLVAAAEAGDTAAAFLALNQNAADLRRVQERLERTADAAETDKQRVAVASLSGQQLRAAEVRAKLGGVGGYATPRTDKPPGAPFVLNIIFSDRETTRIEGTPMDPDDPMFNAVPAVPWSIGDTHYDASGVVDERDDEADFDEDV
jgi:hypothetical protein